MRIGQNRIVEILSNLASADNKNISEISPPFPEKIKEFSQNKSFGRKQDKETDRIHEYKRPGQRMGFHKKQNYNGRYDLDQHVLNKSYEFEAKMPGTKFVIQIGHTCREEPDQDERKTERIVPADELNGIV